MVNRFVHFLAAKNKVERRFDLKMTVSEIAFHTFLNGFFFVSLFFSFVLFVFFCFDIIKCIYTDHWVFISLFAVIFRVYCADHTYCTLRFPINATTEMIKASAADKLQLNRSNEDLVLAEIKSNGERTIFKDHDVSIPTALYLNARIFVSSKDHIDALVSESSFTPIVLSPVVIFFFFFVFVLFFYR